MTNKQVLKIFKKVYNTLKQGCGLNWCNDGLFGDCGCYCVLGHINFLIKNCPCSGAAFAEPILIPLNEAAEELYGVDSIVTVNDCIGLDAVLSCLEYTINHLEVKIENG